VFPLLCGDERTRPEGQGQGRKGLYILTFVPKLSVFDWRESCEYIVLVIIAGLWMWIRIRSRVVRLNSYPDPKGLKQKTKQKIRKVSNFSF
jgi:hypothetical protein